MDDNAAVGRAPTELGAQAARGTAASLSAQVVMTAIYAATSITLARLLSPEDFGVFAIAFAVVAVLDIAQHGGMIVPLVQTRTLSPAQLASLFWFCAAVGAAQAVCGWLAAPLAAWLYGDSRIAEPIVVLALGFLATGLTTTQMAQLRRKMRFSRLAVFEVSAVAGAAAVAIVSARLGAGYWSLVYLQVTRQLLFGGMVMLAGGAVPQPRLRREEIGPLVRFGRVMVVFEATGFVNSKLDNLIVAWFAGPTSLGFYAKAFEFVQLASNQINLPIGNVAHATLSRVQDDPRRYRTSLINALLLTTTVSIPLIVFISAHAPLLFVILFGEQWLPSATIFRTLAPGAVTMTITAGVGWIFLSLGRARRQLPWTLATSAATLAAFLAGARWGALGVATAFSATRVLFLVPTVMFTCHDTPVSWPSVLAAAVRPLTAAAAAALVSSTVAQLLPASAFSIAVVAGLFAACYLASWAILPGGLALIRQQLAFVRSVFRNA